MKSFLHPVNVLQYPIALIPRHYRLAVLQILGFPLGIVSGLPFQHSSDSVKVAVLLTLVAFMFFVYCTTRALNCRDHANEKAQEMLQSTENMDLLNDMYKYVMNNEKYDLYETVRPRPPSQEFIEALRNAGAREELVKALEKARAKELAKLGES